MNAERLEIARRLVACPGWVWMPGFRAAWTHGGGVDMRVIGGDALRVLVAFPQSQFTNPRSIARVDLIPDLDDPVTAAGILPVVRRALNLPNLVAIIGADGWYLHGIPDDRPELWWSDGKASELLALLAALEAAPK